jgi:hypothetical protein
MGNHGKLSAAMQAAIVGGAVAGLGAFVVPMAIVIGGNAGGWAAAAAGGVCLAGTLVGQALSRFLDITQRPVAAVLWPMAARFVLPLGCGLACQIRGGDLAEGGVLYYLLVFYPLTLGVETVLSLSCSPIAALGRLPGGRHGNQRDAMTAQLEHGRKTRA